MSNFTLDRTINGYSDTPADNSVGTTSKPSPTPQSGYLYRLKTNICRMCDFRCMQCYGPYNNNCTNCVNNQFKWNQYPDICHHYCPEGQYTAVTGLVGELILPLSINTRICTKCDPGCQFCSYATNNCSMCQDNYFLIDDKAECEATYNPTTCPRCNFQTTSFTLFGSTYTGDVVVNEGCQSRDSICQQTKCPDFFYFELYRTYSSTSELSSTNPRYNFFTQNKSLDRRINGYSDNSSDPRVRVTAPTSPSPDSGYYYRQKTNLCKMCDYRCMKCYGPSNFNCTMCVNNYYKWVQIDVCESYCPESQYKLDYSGTVPYPRN